MANKVNGAIIYQGPSMLDGSPIIVVATGLAAGSANTKTGAMLQTWILRADIKPTDAIHSGADEAICGDCKHRGTVNAETGRVEGRTCYVLVHNAPRAVYVTFTKGRYATMAPQDVGRGRKVRIGSYGDPAAVPHHIWAALVSEAISWTGYTHQWARFPGLAAFCMASADSEVERAQAKLLGFRTFRVKTADADVLPGEIGCPAAKENGAKTNCAACQLCKGAVSRSRKDIVINAHGAGTKKFAALSVELGKAA